MQHADHGRFAPPPGGFGPPGAPFTPPEPQFNPLAITSMVLGILSMPCCCCCCGAPLGVAALATGLLSLHRIRRDPQSWKGGAMSVAGIATGSLGLFLELMAVFMEFDDALRARYMGSFF